MDTVVYGDGGYDPAQPWSNAAYWWDDTTRLAWAVTDGAATSRAYREDENARADALDAAQTAAGPPAGSIAGVDPIAFAGTSWPTWDYTTSPAFVGVAEATTVKSLPGVTVTVAAITDGTATGEVRLTGNGDQLGDVTPVPAGSLTRFTIGPADVPGAPGETVNLALQARVASGSGKCYGRVVAATQSPTG